jgi:hypothetical protein
MNGEDECIVDQIESKVQEVLTYIVEDPKKTRVGNVKIGGV